MGIDYNHNNSRLNLLKYSNDIEKFLKEIAVRLFLNLAGLF